MLSFSVSLHRYSAVFVYVGDIPFPSNRSLLALRFSHFAIQRARFGVRRGPVSLPARNERRALFEDTVGPRDQSVLRHSWR